MEIANRVFVVTGGGNGMGRQVALSLVRRGARVALADLSQEGLDETVRLAAAGDRVSAHVLNVTDRAEVERFPEAVASAHGAVDAVVNIAGTIHRFVPFTELTIDEEERIMNVNFWGTVNMCRAFLPLLTARPEAALVNMSSLAALIPFAGQTFYGASKGAVKQFSEGLYAELLGTSVSVITLFPGNISTSLAANSGVEMIDPKGQKVRSTTPEEAGRIIVDGIARNSFRVLVGADAKMLERLTRVSARRTTALVASRMKSVL